MLNSLVHLWAFTGMMEINCHFYGLQSLQQQRTVLLHLTGHFQKQIGRAGLQFPLHNRLYQEVYTHKYQLAIVLWQMLQHFKMVLPSRISFHIILVLSY